jgi:hypothetical protein
MTNKKVLVYIHWLPVTNEVDYINTFPIAPPTLAIRRVEHCSVNRFTMRLAIVRLSRLCTSPFRSHFSHSTRMSYGWRDETASRWTSPEEMEKARRWVETFRLEDIPKKACTVACSTSSGPGGQNVNK